MGIKSEQRTPYGRAGEIDVHSLTTRGFRGRGRTFLQRHTSLNVSANTVASSGDRPVGDVLALKTTSEILSAHSFSLSAQRNSGLGTDSARTKSSPSLVRVLGTSQVNLTKLSIRQLSPLMFMLVGGSLSWAVQLMTT